MIRRTPAWAKEPGLNNLWIDKAMINRIMGESNKISPASTGRSFLMLSILPSAIEHGEGQVGPTAKESMLIFGSSTVCTPARCFG